MIKKSTGLIFTVILLSLCSEGLAQTLNKPNLSLDDYEALQRLECEIVRLAKLSGGIVGITARHIESGRRVSLNGGESFPMASTYKIPIAVQLLIRVDRGEVKLDSLVEIKKGDLHPGSGTISDVINQPGLILSIRNLLELMLLISDNSATDVLLQIAGGSGAVTNRMRLLGIEGISVSRPTLGMIADWLGVQVLPPEEKLLEFFEKLFRVDTTEAFKQAAKRFDADRRDVSAPDAMAALLEQIYINTNLLKSESRTLLLDIMKRCRTGSARLKGMLPSGTDVAHKTGTIGGTTNDVGIITLPDEAGHVAIAIFVKSSEKEIPEREHVIAEIARSVYDFFLFRPAAPSTITQLR